MHFGWLSLIPPIVAIGMAFVTRRVILSLFAGILVGALIVTGWHPVDGFVKMFSVIWAATELGNFVSFARFNSSWNLFILLFTTTLGIIIVLVNRAGGARAYGEWAARCVRSKRGASFFTMFLGILIFFDDYFNCLTIGTVMKPITDKFKMSRAKLAYLIDATAAPVVILAPISTWVAEVISQLRTAGVGTQIPVKPFGLFMRTVFFNSYAWLTLVMVGIVCWGGFEFGAMKQHEETAQTSGNLFNGQKDFKRREEAVLPEVSEHGRIIDLVLPLGTMILLVLCAMLFTGGFVLFGGKNGFVQAFLEMNSAQSLFWGGAMALGFTVLWMKLRGLIPFKEIPGHIINGFKIMWPAISILVLAWTIGSLIKNDLKTGQYLAGIVSQDFPVGLLPAILFLLSCLMSFATGTSWGTFGIMIPIAVPLAATVAPELLVPMIGAILAGAVYGDHASPISDTTILSSAGAGCDHIQHVKTQYPYATIVAAVCLVGFVLTGYTIRFGLVIAGALNLLVGLLVLLGMLRLLNQKKLPVSSQTTVFHDVVSGRQSVS